MNMRRRSSLSNRHKHGPTVKRTGDYIHIFRMNHPKVVSDLLREIQSGISENLTSFSVFVDKVTSAYPNVCVPMAGLLDYYREKGIKFSVEFLDENGYASNANIDSPLLVPNNSITLRRASLDDTWKFHDSEDIQNLVDAFVQQISELAVCEPGVLEGLTWCLNEVMDNVIQHSGVKYGYAMGQIHQTSKHIAFCIFDYGLGIYNSLKDTKHSPRHPLDAITLAVKEGITRDSSIGQGNGMWGLHNIVKSNSGSLAITSNGASYTLKGNELQTYSRLPVISNQVGCTTVDFQIDFDKKISIADALGGYTPLNLRTYRIENDDGELIYEIAEKASGTGTRQSGQRVRTDLINLHNESQTVIKIDFANVPVISSSFADELIGKLVSTYGFFGFNQVFRLDNMNQIVQSIVNRSVAQRMSQSFVEED